MGNSSSGKLSSFNISYCNQVNTLTKNCLWHIDAFSLSATLVAERKLNCFLDPLSCPFLLGVERAYEQ